MVNKIDLLSDSNTRLSMSDILTKNSGYSRYRLKERLIETGMSPLRYVVRQTNS